MIGRFADWWAGVVFRRALLVLWTGFVITFLAVKSASHLGVSTQIEALMPQGTQTVQTLNAALRKTGSFASIQIVATSDNPDTAQAFIEEVKDDIDRYDWVKSSQFSEDVSVLEEHKLLLLSYDELLTLEADINEAYPVIVAKEISKALGSEVTFTLRDDNVSGNSNTELNKNRLEELQNNISAAPETDRYFKSPDGKTIVLVVWPKPGLDALADAKRMVDDSNDVVRRVMTKDGFEVVVPGVAGRIANKVAQFDAIIGDLKIGLLTSITLIALLIGWSYRSVIALPLILIPLSVGIIWTMGMVAQTIGGLNLITVFLTLILFGLGIDFGIHNFSRYREERRNGHSSEMAIAIVIRQTGGASLIAALTTASAFFSLMLTEFRAFTEFGFIAGMGIVLTFLSMYSIFPALAVAFERLGWRADKIKTSNFPRVEALPLINPLKHRKLVLRAGAVLVLFCVIFAPQIEFERNIKNLEAKQPTELVTATQSVGKVFSDSHDRAIIVVETIKELEAIDEYFNRLIASDTDTPTINKVTSLLDFVPSQDNQRKRLEVIRRLEKRAESLQALNPDQYETTKRYLTINDLNVADIPQALRTTFLGTQVEPGYLMYVYNSVSMDDSRTAKLFYDDAAQLNVGGNTYYSASEGFIFVEMIALMKADAIKAISLVTLTTAILVFIFVRSFRATWTVLLAPLLGVLVTIAVMGAFGPTLSIMNMVILPSLIGIAVDNAIHIFHRFELEGEDADIPKIMNSTGRAAVLTTLTTLIGFGGMITASMGGLRSMGILAIIGFTSCLIMTWVLLPILLQFYHDARQTKEPNHVAY